MKNKNNYFSMFEELVDLTLKASKCLLESLTDFNPQGCRPRWRNSIISSTRRI